MTIARISGTFFSSENDIVLSIKAPKSQHGYIEKMFITFISVIYQYHIQVYFKAFQRRSYTEHPNAAYRQHTRNNIPYVSVLLISIW